MPHIQPIRSEDIAKYLKSNIQPIPDRIYGDGYRASVYLSDGTYLPCVIFRNPKEIVKLAKRRFDEEKNGKSIFHISIGNGYDQIVKTFVTSGNCINNYEISKVEISPYAFPKTVLSKINGETSMGWTGFVIRMKDGRHFSFGTSFRFEFFDLPRGYQLNDIEEVINHSYTGPAGEPKPYRGGDSSDFDSTKVFREKPFFECFIDEL